MVTALGGLARVDRELRDAMLALAGGEHGDALRQLAATRKRLQQAHQRLVDLWWREFWRPYRGGGTEGAAGGAGPSGGADSADVSVA